MQVFETNLKLPKNLYLETTNRCNLRCRACILYRGSWESPRDLSLEELILIIQQLPELKLTALHGIGEPLLNPELPDMIRYLKERKIFVLFNSNGILLDESRQDKLIDTGLDELRISLDAASPQGYKDMRNSDEFERIVGNLQSFSKRMQTLQVTNPRLSLWYLGTRKNMTELPAFVRLAASIGVAEVYLQRLVYFQDGERYGLARPDETLSDSDDMAVELLQQSQELAKQLDVQFNASGLCYPLESVQVKSSNQTPWKRCFRPQTLMYITANGNVLPCCISPFSTSDYTSIILGNAFETSLMEIWSGAKYKKFRKNHQTNTPPKCCQGCGVLWSL